MVGAGALGSVVLPYLVAGGIGHLVICDHDLLEISNLSRQTLYRTPDVGIPKALLARDTLKTLNPQVQIDTVLLPMDIENAKTLIESCDLTIDCGDSVALSYLINDMSASLQKPWVYASSVAQVGMAALFVKDSACFRCLYPSLSAPQNCNTAGILGPVAGIAASYAAALSMNHLNHTSLHSRLFYTDMKAGDSQSVMIPRRRSCSGHDGKVEVMELPLSQAKERGIQVIDIRREEDFKAAHIQGAKSIPATKLHAEHPLLEGDVLLCCYRGVQSLSARSRLIKEGYPHAVYSLRERCYRSFERPASALDIVLLTCF